MTEQSDILYLWRIRKSYLTSIVSISLVLFLLGAMGFLILNAGQLSDYVKENIGFALMLKDNTKESDIFRLQKTLDAAKYTKSTQYITKEEAARKLEEDLGEDFVDFLGYNPLLSSIEVQLKAEYANVDSITKIEKQLETYRQVKEVFYQKHLIQQVNENVRRISFIILIFGGMLLIISIALINNSIRLSIYARRFLINTMKLVGATKDFIRRPFLVTAFVNGLMGGILANFMLMGLIRIVNNEFDDIVRIQHIGLIFLLTIVIGIIITVASTWFTVNKYLKMSIDKLYI